MPDIHPFILIIDYILGLVMWTLIGRVAMNIFQRENSEFFFMKAFVKLTNPLIHLFRPITPSFIITAPLSLKQHDSLRSFVNGLLEKLKVFPSKTFVLNPI